MRAASPIDVVLGGASEPAKRRRGLRVAAWVVALVIHAVVVGAALRSGPSLEAWSAELALEVHEALVDDQVIELATPKSPEPPAQPAPTVTRRASPASPSHAHAPTPTTPAPAAPAPAQAAAVVTQGDAPLDLTGTTVVTGSATHAIGGASATTGTSTEHNTAETALPVPSPVPVAPAAPSLSRPVQLDASRWRCAWPDEAISQDIYEQAVVLRVVVLADGSVEAAQLVDDPGLGFGRAALACAKRTSFTPALDPNGRPVRALSPPIRVRFTR